MFDLSPPNFQNSDIFQATIERSGNMSKVMQNVVLLIEPSEKPYNISLKAGNMYLNRFCIDEDAAFESTGVYYLKKYPIVSIDLMDYGRHHRAACRAKGQRKFYSNALKYYGTYFQ